MATFTARAIPPKPESDRPMDTGARGNRHTYESHVTCVTENTHMQRGRSVRELNGMRRLTVRRWGSAPSIGGGERLSSPSRLRDAGRRPTWPAVLVGMLMLVALPLWWMNGHRGASSLRDVALEGPRGPVCLRMVVANDVSGSMVAFTQARENALGQFVSWAQANLRGDDELGVLDFAGGASWTRRPAAIGQVASAVAGTGAASNPNPSSTALQPVLDATAALPPTTCDTVLVLLSDGVYQDLPPDADAGLASLRAAGVHDLALLVPSGDIEIPREWTAAFPATRPRVFDGLNADASGLAYGAMIADLTGQTLRRT
jgi:hypothetical protein